MTSDEQATLRACVEALWRCRAFVNTEADRQVLDALRPAEALLAEPVASATEPDIYDSIGMHAKVLMDERDAALARAEQAEREQAREHDRAVDALGERDRLAAEVEWLRGEVERGERGDHDARQWIGELKAELATARRERDLLRDAVATFLRVQDGPTPTGFGYVELTRNAITGLRIAMVGPPPVERGPAKE